MHGSPCSRQLIHCGVVEYIGDRPTDFTDELFAGYAKDEDGCIEFAEFVHAVCRYCLYSESEILDFIFSRFDVDGGGQIDDEEYSQLVVAMQPQFLSAKEDFSDTFSTKFQDLKLNKGYYVAGDQLWKQVRTFQAIGTWQELNSADVRLTATRTAAWIEKSSKLHTAKTLFYFIQHSGLVVSHACTDCGT